MAKTAVSHVGGAMRNFTGTIATLGTATLGTATLRTATLRTATLRTATLRTATLGLAGVLAWSLLTAGPAVAAGTAETAVAAGTAVAAETAVALPAGAKTTPTNDFLYSISCFSAKNCTAVGNWAYHSEFVQSHTLAERWNGSKWSKQTTPEPSASSIARFDGVACPTAKMCVAVGADFTGLGSAYTNPILAVWNGSKWTLDKIKEPSGGSNGFLEGVACSGARQCLAVGYYVNRSNSTQNLVETWNGSTWTAGVPANSSASYNVLDGIACPARNDCFAVGQYRNAASEDVTFTDKWNGSSWSPQPTPSPASALSRLNGVGCTNTTRCMSVGNRESTTSAVPPTDTLAEHWNGSSWTRSLPGNPSGNSQPNNNLNAVSCPGLTNCLAVGAYTNKSGTSVTLGEKWSGSKWTITKTPTVPKAAFGSYFLGVACASAKYCLAVGYSQTKGSTQYAALSEFWGGGKWTLVPVP